MLTESLFIPIHFILPSTLLLSFIFIDQIFFLYFIKYRAKMAIPVWTSSLSMGSLRIGIAGNSFYSRQGRKNTDLASKGCSLTSTISIAEAKTKWK